MQNQHLNNYPTKTVSCSTRWLEFIGTVSTVLVPNDINYKQ